MKNKILNEFTELVLPAIRAAKGRGATANSLTAAFCRALVRAYVSKTLRHARSTVKKFPTSTPE
jgi:hypothetical protein